MAQYVNGKWQVDPLRLSKLNDDNVIVQFQFDTGSTTDSFDAWYEWYSDVKKMWVLSGGTPKSISTRSWETIDGKKWFQDTWSVPKQKDATKVRVGIKPVPTKDASWKASLRYTGAITNPWVEAQASEEERRALERPDPPSSIGAEVVGSSVRVSLECSAPYATQVIIQRSENGAAWANVATVSKTAVAWTDKNVAKGSQYRYRAASALRNGTQSVWTSATDAVDMAPAAPTNLAVRALTSESARLDWKNEGRTGDRYGVEWSDDGKAWANNDRDNIHTATIDAKTETRYTVSGLDTGKRWYFRVYRENDAGKAWATAASATIVSAILATQPTAPTVATTPTSTSTAASVTFSWTHNSEDGCDQSAYEIELTGTKGTRTLSGTGKTQTRTETAETLGGGDGTNVSWRVRTKGILDAWSPWSRKQTIRFWAEPSVDLDISPTDGQEGASRVISQFPLTVSAGSPSMVSSNSAIAWWATITARQSMPYVDETGEYGWIYAGQVMWSCEADVPSAGATKTSFTKRINAWELSLIDGAEYDLNAGCVTSQGMRSEAAPVQIIARLADSDMPSPMAEVEWDEDTLSARIWPWCNATNDGAEPGARGSLRSNTELSVYRVEANGEQTLIVEGLPNDGLQWVVDAHPRFGMCTWRVVAQDLTTGAQSSSEIDAETHCDSICIQWKEDWAIVDTQGVDGIAYEGTRLMLPYDIKIDESYAPDVAMREYAGREHPVSYYGTQRGSRASWSANMVRFGEEASLALLRELARRMEDVYVREPSGLSYWAHIEVAGISQDAASGKVGVSLSVTPTDHEESAYG